MNTSKSIMAIFAHADDVELACGGTLSKYRKLFNYSISYIMSTNNMSGSWCKLNADGKLESRKCPWHEIMPQRKKEADDAARAYYGTEAIHLDLPQRHYLNDNLEKIDLRFGNPQPEGTLPDCPSILTGAEDPATIGRLAELILEQDPEIIFTHAAVDPNPEHTCTTWLVIRAYKKAKEQGYNGSLLLFAGRHSGEAAASYSRGDTFIDISGEWLRLKTEALSLHACQSAGIFAERICKSGFPAPSAVSGVEAAECFIIHQLNDSPGPLTEELQHNSRFFSR